jgi:hypothetical protein
MFIKNYYQMIENRELQMTYKYFCFKFTKLQFEKPDLLIEQGLDTWMTHRQRPANGMFNSSGSVNLRSH